MSLNLLCRGLWLAILITVVSPNLVQQQSCSAGYTLCSPPGATGSSTYDTSEGLLYLFLNILGTVQPSGPGASPQPIDPNGPAKRESVITTMCCASGLSCLLLINANVPMCYDKYTTDFALPNGDYGTVSNGSLVTAGGVHVDLISGDYIVPNGQISNIYISAASEKPSTATLTIPIQDTSSGVGSAIPASQLGSSASHTSQAIVTVTASSSILSLSGAEVTPCSTCCNACDRPSTTVVATMPTITSTPSGSGTGTATFPSYTTGIGNATITPPITVGAGDRLMTCVFTDASVAIVTTMLLLIGLD